MLVIGLVLILCLSAFGARNSPVNSRLRVQSPEDPTKTLRLVHTVRFNYILFIESVGFIRIYCLQNLNFRDYITGFLYIRDCSFEC